MKNTDKPAQGAGNAASQEACVLPPVLQPHERAGYQGFGSFFSDNVEDLIALDKEQYVSPALPFQLEPGPDSLAIHRLPELPLGAACRGLFMIDFARWTFINHGAFGGVCMPAHREAAQWREYCEKQPLKFIDRELFPHMVRVLRQLASFMHARPQDLALMPNATTGLNTVIKSMDMKPGDVMYMLDIGYGSVKKMLHAACQDAQVVFGQVKFPIRDPQEVVDLVARTMPPSTKLAVFDAVTSNTAVALPLAELVALCKSRGVRVLVDAAHALLQQPVDVTTLDADFYVANCHKWLAGPRGSAVMWVHPRVKARIKPLVVSHGSGSGFTSDFIWDGCRDYAPYLALSSTLNMWQALGVDRCRAYMRDLLYKAVQLLVAAWGTDTLVPLSMCACMALVRLPHAQGLTASTDPNAATSADAKYVQDHLHGLRVECPVKCIQGRLYVRISAHIYNTLPEYQRLADAVAQIVASHTTAQQQQQQSRL